MVKNVVPFSQFDTSLMIEYSAKASDILDTDYWRLLKSLTYDVGFKGSSQKVIVPQGYLTDGASIPKGLWWIAAPQGKHGAAAAVHDWLCEYLRIYDNGVYRSITRKEADKIFKEALINSGLSWWLAHVMYWGVTAYRQVARVRKPNFSAQKANLEDRLRMEEPSIFNR